MACTLTKMHKFSAKMVGKVSAVNGLAAGRYKLWAACQVQRRCNAHPIIIS